MKCQEDDRQRECSVAREVSDKMVCSACRCPFNNREEQVLMQLHTSLCSVYKDVLLMIVDYLFFPFQMEHYKLDWHRFNLRHKMSGLPPVTAEEFERKTGTGERTRVQHSYHGV